MLLIDVEELWNRHTHLVRAPDQVSFVTGFLIFDSFSPLVIADGLVNGVRDLSKSLLSFVVDELFLLDLDLVGFVDRLVFENDRSHQERNDEALYSVLLLVIHLNSHVGTLFDLVVGELRVGTKLIPVYGPEVAEHKHSIYCD